MHVCALLQACGPAEQPRCQRIIKQNRRQATLEAVIDRSQRAYNSVWRVWLGAVAAQSVGHGGYLIESQRPCGPPHPEIDVEYWYLVPKSVGVFSAILP